ncbi:BQ5605_C025g09992 [Microbotryum silenes-dioicae]|uniref:BQ5605_C025g09992 protein n=1 Tax=Microbotryum silenes-dioicae TaxID=796604 RepID=A0A2X0PLM1_9BASI|nr:BQ5605_C025g09992 [Microbotryum silenes-dioicae]
MSKSFDDSDSTSDMSPSAPTYSTSVPAGARRPDVDDGDAGGVGIGAGAPQRSSTSTTKRARKVKERLRITHACERCKYKKARCNGDQPVCANCSKSKAECIYQPELDGRKRKKLTRTTLPARSGSSSSSTSHRIMEASREDSLGYHQGSGACASEPGRSRPRSTNTAANHAHVVHGPNPRHDRPPTSDPTGAFAATSADDADNTVRSPPQHHHGLSHHHPHSAAPSHYHHPHQLPPPHPHHHPFEPDGPPDLPGNLVDSRWTPSHHHASSAGGNSSVDRLSLPPEHFHHSPHQPLPHMSLLNLSNPILPPPTGPGWPMVSPHQISPSIDHGQYHEQESPFHHQQQPLHPPLSHSHSHPHPHSLSHPHSHSQPHHPYPPHQDQNQHQQQQQHSEQQQQHDHENQKHQRSGYDFHHNPPVLPSYIGLMGPNHPHTGPPILGSVPPVAGGQASALSPSPSPPPHHGHHQLHHLIRHDFAAHPSQDPPSSVEADPHHAGVDPGASGGSLDQLSALAAERHGMEDYRPMGRPIEFNYLRPFGPTAIQPGLQQVSLSLSSIEAHQPMMGTPGPRDPHRRTPYSLARHGNHLFRDPSPPDHLYAPGSDIPRQDVLDDLVPLFFLRMGSEFPFLNVRHVQEACGLEPFGISHPQGRKSGSLSSTQLDGPLLVNTICAAAARFSEASSIVQLEQEPATWGIAFANKAKQLLTPLLGLPSSGTVASLLLLAHHEFGLNSEGALWMYTGMAVRMAQDIGLHLNIRRPTSDRRKRAQDSLLWWSCVTMDRVLSIGTGRASMAKEHELFLPAPTDEDIQVVAQDVAVPNLRSLLPSPFPHYVALQRLVGQLADIVNGTSTNWGFPMDDGASADDDREAISAESSHRLAGSGTERGAEDLYALEHEIRTLYHNLPRDLGWSTSNFRRQIARGTVPVYLHLHLWYHAVMIILYRTPVLHPKLNAAKPALTDRLRQSIVSSACDSIREVLAVSETIDASRIASCPFVHQPLFVAALAWAQEYRLRTGRDVLSAPPLNSHARAQIEGNTEANGPGSASAAGSDILAIEASKNYHLASAALARQSQFWLGVRGIVKLLERHAIGASGEGVDPQIHPSGSQVLLTLCSENEMGILARLHSRMGGGFDAREGKGMATPSMASTSPQGEVTNRDQDHRHRPMRLGEQQTVDALFGMLHPPTSMLGDEGGVLRSSIMSENGSSSNVNNRPPTSQSDSAPNASPRVDLTHDDFALAYTFAGSIPADGAPRTGPSSAPVHGTQPSASWR